MEPRSRLHLLSRGALAAPSLMVIMGLGTAQAKVLLTQKEALELAFPAAPKIDRRTAYLTQEQVRQAATMARAKVESRVWTYYVGTSSTGTAGYAYFETHAVRSMPETFMAVLDDGGRLRFVEVLAFHEPEDYRPPPRWLAQFQGKGGEDDLMVRRGLRNIAGATLTSHALSEGVRRVLAIHAIIHARAP